MEPPTKRPRLLTPLDGKLAQYINNPNEYDVQPDSELDEDENYIAQDSQDSQDDDDDDDDDEDGDPEEDDYEDYDENCDPNEEFIYRRKQLHNKLKATFEAIFEKYGRDFDGIGDEIDLGTGDILVNNGHLLKMQDERDAGSPRGNIDDETGLSLQSEGVNSSLGEHDVPDEEEDRLGTHSNDMTEDDMVLGGFVRPRLERFLEKQPSAKEISSTDGNEDHAEDLLDKVTSPQGLRGSVMPSYSDIVGMFGSQLGPQIIKYISKQRGCDVAGIEPAWWAPDIPSAATVGQPVLSSLMFQPEIERSLSPDTATSVWAPKRRPGRRRKDGTDSEAIFRGESVPAKQYIRKHPIRSFKQQSSIELGQAAKASRTRKLRTVFTAEDDKLLMDWVVEARDHGITSMSPAVWQQLELLCPRHTWACWKARYHYRLSPHWSIKPDDSDLSTSEASTSTSQMLQLRQTSHNLALSFAASATFAPPRSESRLRRPAQRDPTIIGWSEDVATIELLDPELHPGLPEGLKAPNHNDSLMADCLSTPSESNFPDRDLLQTKADSIRRVDLDSGNSDSGKQLGIYTSNLPMKGRTEVPESLCSDIPTVSGNEDILPETAPCPHADCAIHPTRLYRIGRHGDEEQSPLSLHLHTVYQAGPPTSKKLNFERKGEQRNPVAEQIVTHNPSFSWNSFKRKEQEHPCPLKDSTGCDRTFTTFSIAYRHSKCHSSEKVKCPYPGCESSFNGARKDNLKQHLRRCHGNYSLNATSSAVELKPELNPKGCFGETGSNTTIPTSEPVYPSATIHVSKPPSQNIVNPYYEFSDEEISMPSQAKKAPLPSVVDLNPQRPSGEPGSGSAIPTSEPARSSRRTHIRKPHARNTIDPSYEFSDEEIGSKELPKECLSASSIKNPSHLGCGRSSASPPPAITPPTQKMARKVVHQDLADSEDFDELSLGADDSVLMSSQPRIGFRAETGCNAGVKIQKLDITSTNQCEAVISGPKRKSRVWSSNDDMDELSVNDPALLSSTKLRPVSNTNYEMKNRICWSTSKSDGFPKTKKTRSKMSTFTKGGTF